jgi:DNA-binding PucR family transcriptional regulator
VSLHNSNVGTSLISYTSLEPILNNIHETTRQGFYLSVLGPLVTSNYGIELIKTLEQVLTDNLNISQAARSLYLHRNTLLYRLDKIKTLTGLDPRCFEDAVLLKIALTMHKNNKNYLTISHRIAY